jgi:DNA-binding MarR family transcriptional regulator
MDFSDNGTLTPEMTSSGTLVLLTRLAKAVHRASTEELLGITLRQFVMLSYLRERDAMPQQELCESLLLDANNCVLLLNELEQAGYAERKRDVEDRRRHLVNITASGRRAVDHAERARESLEDQVLAGLSAEERATLATLLSRALEVQPAAVR